MNEPTFLLEENGEPKISKCSYDKEKCCNCMTYSILHEDKTHYICGKCGATK